MIPSEASIRSFLPLPVKKSGNHLICTCYICNRPDKFYYNINTGLNDCKSGCTQGNIYTFLRGWNQLHLLQGEQINYKKDIKSLGDTIEEELLDLELPDCRLPVGFTKLKWDSKNIYTEYLKSRKYTEEDFQFYQPGVTNLVDKYNKYVIIPVTRDYQVKGFVGRYIGKDEAKTRYENSKRTKFTKIIDGYDQLSSNTKSLVVVEGHFDKVSVNTELKLYEQEEWKCIATFGKKFSEYQLELLNKTNVQDLYFMYDFSDAVNDVKKFGIKANKLFNVYGCYRNTTKDPGNMNKEEILRSLDTAEPIRSYVYSKVQTGHLK